ncbi:tRNA pseudouridine synthase A [Brevibacterium album]|uniref:tRNA pseudouridine synthase A n=1 Tax=Brevibacterium album TaxID=417948 RepID=UPI0004039CF5|nr:tRNA pseudouridine synthase A [Brevibacterium album]
MGEQRTGERERARAAQAETAVPGDGSEPAEAVHRFRLDLGYAGGGFHGWAAQPGLRTVQGVFEDALERICGMRVRTVVAGRTDAGVHARRQVVHLDLPESALLRLAGGRAPAAAPQATGTRQTTVQSGAPAAPEGDAADPRGRTSSCDRASDTPARGRRRGPRTPAEALVSRLRGVLAHLDAPDVEVHGAQEVPAEFDARFSAIWRRYSYRIADASAFRDPLSAGHTVRLRTELDADAMAQAARQVLGLHDFLPFCKPRPGSTTIRTLQSCEVERDADGVLTVGLRADAFCHHMVRALVGALVKVGQGAWAVTEPAVQLARAEGGADRDALAPMHLMPAHGLVLEEVGYPEDAAGWARQAESARKRRSAEELAG